ncbi:MAG: SUMF1/EgtB/PvdO family nonheme iron enzyme [Leptospirales bacterium]|nr:SUMF1/EgtB/PvdO family nonheme iron enzyme [Leptospirales bacterium]
MRKFIKLSVLLLVALSSLLIGCGSDSGSGSSEKVYTITFDANEGVGGPGALQAVYGKAMPIISRLFSTAPQRDGFYFAGYYDAQTGGTMYYTAELTPAKGYWDKTSNATLYAHWTKTEEAVIIYYKNDGGSTTKTQTVELNAWVYLEANTFAREGYTFEGWAITETGTVVYADGANYTTASSTSIALYAVWSVNEPGQVVITFHKNDGTNETTTQTVSENTTITLRANTFTRGTSYTFSGWATSVTGAVEYADGANYTVATTGVNLYAVWSNEEGIYIGIIKFAGISEDITGGAPILLNEAGRTSLVDTINSQISISSYPGTALFHAVHLALANLKKNEYSYPNNLDFVNIITFTDGLDITSAGLSLVSAIEGQEFSTAAAYTTYVNTQINNRKIADKSITAYSVGVKGSDVTDDTRFTNDLASLASAGKSNELSDFADLQDTFNDIAEGLNIITTTTNFRLTTTLIEPGSKVRMTFDVNTTVPTDAAASTRYIEGTYTYSGGTYSLTNITYGGGISSRQGAGPITGTLNSSSTGVSFVFNDITGYTPSTDESKTRQWLMASGASTWQHNSEYSSSGSNDSTVEKRSAVIYLVLDCSGSLSTTEVAQIRDAAVNFINNLYGVWSGDQYTITFDANEGSGGPTTVKVAKVSYEISMPNLSSQALPTRAGYDFTGYFDAYGTKYYNNDLTSAKKWDKASNATLYAQWTGKTYTITFNDNSGSGGPSSSVTATYGSPMPAITSVPTKVGFYAFTGYFDAQTGGTMYYTENLTSAKNWDKTDDNTTLYAQWEEIEFELEMVWIPGGTFTMGSPTGESGRSSEETQHSVTLTTGFYMGKYQVTQEQYFAVMKTKPSSFSSSPATGEIQEKRPVEEVSWYDALVFCNRLSVKEGLDPAYSMPGFGNSTDPADWGPVPTSSDGTWDNVVIVAGSTGYRLPTEAQWEYACRAGTTTAYNTNSNTISSNTGWYSSNSGSKTHQVGLKDANDWGLYDMHGNVYEWCWDWYSSSYYSSSPSSDPEGPVSGSYRVERGGAWNYNASHMRSAFRYYDYPYYGGSSLGFRVVRP